MDACSSYKLMSCEVKIICAIKVWNWKGLLTLPSCLAWKLAQRNIWGVKLWDPGLTTPHHNPHPHHHPEKNLSLKQPQPSNLNLTRLPRTTHPSPGNGNSACVCPWNQMRRRGREGGSEREAESSEEGAVGKAWPSLMTTSWPGSRERRPTSGADSRPGTTGICAHGSGLWMRGAVRNERELRDRKGRTGWCKRPAQAQQQERNNREVEMEDTQGLCQRSWNTDRDWA